MQASLSENIHWVLEKGNEILIKTAGVNIKRQWKRHLIKLTLKECSKWSTWLLLLSYHNQAFHKNIWHMLDVWHFAIITTYWSYTI